ncbi:hypothetical protein SAMN02745130_03137 [Thiothrix eikelboomii]|uniref:Uncharacterized protein n=1 Tax=Thiothrix eikelboomii TaxID=92487 RepID=A0A1T4XLI5_9GAMM|nr:hypothetical protein [Thiothrix eikelboomii]SKA90356.1 hypothetical protein SAMN02745130_03137 [Thiothrix eikelboomii]
MNDVKNTNETNPELATEGVNAKLNTEAATEASQTGNSNKRGGCGEWSKCGGSWQQGKRRWKVFAAAALIAVFGFMLGKASSHHHSRHHGYQQSMQSYDNLGQKLPLSMILDGIEATPAQRAKAVELLR